MKGSGIHLQLIITLNTYYSWCRLGDIEYEKTNETIMKRGLPKLKTEVQEFFSSKKESVEEDRLETFNGNLDHNNRTKEMKVIS